jgi:hypothetical protein
MFQCLMCLERGEYCGGLCVNDPEKRNRFLFHADGRLKTLAERGLALSNEERERAARHVRRVVADVTESPGDVTETPPVIVSNVTESTPDVTKSPPVTESVTKTSGRPPKATKLSAAERKRRQRERAKLKGLSGV